MTQLIYRNSLVSAALILSPMLAASLHAQTGDTWVPGTSAPALWSNAANWDQAVVPVSGYKAFINNPAYGPCIVDGVAGGCQIAIGNGGGPSTIIVTNGGNLSAGDMTFGNLDGNGWTQIGGAGTGTMIIASGGNVTFNYHLWIGQDPGGVGTLIMNGGTASVIADNANWQLGGNGTGYIYMNGGTLYLGKFDSLDRINGNSLMDVSGGVVIVNNDHTSIINTLASQGKITAYGGAGTLHVDYNVTNPGKTTISASLGNLPPAQRITNVSVDASRNVSITYQTTPGFSYHLESTTSLSSPSWNLVSGSSTGSVSGSSVTFNFTDTSGAGAVYYRSVSP